MTFSRALLFGTMLAAVASTSAMAAGPDGLYIRAEGGYAYAPSQEGSVGDPTGLGTDTFHTSQHNGYIAGGALGYKWGAFRVEADFDFAKNRISSISEDSAGGAPVSAGVGDPGSLTNTSGTLNVFYDFDFGLPVTPYVGFGVGAANLSYAGARDVVFQYQPMVGVQYFLSANTALGLEYRFVGTSQGSFSSSIGGFVPPGSHETYESHNILASFTYYLGTPAQPAPPVTSPPPPPPFVPPPPAQEVFLVFFNFDRSDLTDAGQKVVDAAAAQYKAKGFARVEVTGYTDLSGTKAYNLRLSERRAQTVSAALAADGVPSGAMTVVGRGKENPRVPTPDGVREPQNRRVEIVMP